MPPKRFEGKFGIPPSHPVDSLLTQALYRLPESVSIEQIEKLATDISNRVNTARVREGVQTPLTHEEIQTLHLKLARHYEDNGESAVIDLPSCVDALVESPRFLQSDKGSIEKLFEIHEMKTLQKIAEIRKKRAETEEGLNPYENLFETSDGKYYLARLLNMPHLEKESEYMDHCVGTSTSYVNKMKRGEIEIFSLRDTRTQGPIVTIEYDCKSHRLLQIKGKSDRVPSLRDPYASDLIEAIELLGTSVNDAGEKRIVESKEAEHMRHVLTLSEKMKQKKPLSREDLIFLYEINEPIQCFDGGKDPLIKALHAARDPKEDAPLVLDCAPGEIAWDESEYKKNPSSYKSYIGPLFPGIFNANPEHVYTSFPEERVKSRSAALGTGILNGPSFRTAIEGQGMRTGDYAQQLLESPDFKVVGTHESVDLVEVSVHQLGFTRATRYDQICARAQELGLELCPAEVGPQLRLQYTDQPQGEWLTVAMNAISDRDRDRDGDRDGDPRVFSVFAGVGGLWLDTHGGGPDVEWNPDDRLVFLRPRKVEA